MKKIMQRDLQILIGVLLLSALTVVMMDLYIPSLPAIEAYFDVPKSSVQMLITLYMLGFSLSNVIYGPVSDYFGRKPVLIMGLLIGVSGSVVTVLTDSIFFLWIGRFIQGMGFGAGPLLSRAIMSDVFSGVRLAQMGSYMGISTSIAIGLAPAIGGGIEQLMHWKANFLLLLILMVLTTLYLIIFLPETHLCLKKDALQTNILFKNYLKPLSSKIFLVYSVVSGLAFGGLLTYVAIAPFVMQDGFGYSAFEYGSFSLLIAVAQAVSFIFNAKLLGRKGCQYALWCGSFIMLISSFVLFFLVFFKIIDPWVIIVGTLGFIVGSGFIYANVYAEVFSRFKEITGSVAALYGLFQMGVGFIISAILAWMPRKDSFAMASSYVLLSVLIYVLLSTLSIHLRREERRINIKHNLS